MAIFVRPSGRHRQQRENLRLLARQSAGRVYQAIRTVIRERGIDPDLLNKVARKNRQVNTTITNPAQFLARVLHSDWQKDLFHKKGLYETDRLHTRIYQSDQGKTLLPQVL